MRRTTLLTTVLLVLALAAPASASHGDPHGFDRDTFDYHFYYDTGGYVLTVGGTMEEQCASPEPGEAPMRLFVDDDSVQFRVDAADQPAYLYEFDGIAPELEAAVCSGALDLAPIGEGTVRLKVRWTLTFDGEPSPQVAPIHQDIRNSAVGSITTADGTWWRVRAWADFEVGPPPDFAFSDDPADFQGIRLHRTAR
jgi:hypothetical protein